MTLKMLHDRYGKEHGDAKAEKLINENQFAADAHFPTDINFQLFNVYVGTSQKLWPYSSVALLMPTFLGLSLFQ